MNCHHPATSSRRHRTIVITRGLQLVQVAVLSILVVSLFLPPLGHAAAGDVIYVSNSRSTPDKIVRFTGLGAGMDFVTEDVSGANGLALDSHGNLFVASWERGLITKITAEGTTTPFAIVPDDTFMQGLAIDQQDNLFATSARKNLIYKFTREGTRSEFASFSDGLANPTALCFDRQGNLLVSNGKADGHAFSSTILKFAPDGTFSVFAHTGMGYTFGLAIDNQGFVYAGDLHGDVIKKYSADGLSSWHFADTHMDDPAGIAFDSAGNLLVANFGDHTIASFTPEGVGSYFATTGLGGPNFIAVAKASPSAAPSIINVELREGPALQLEWSSQDGQTFTLERSGNLTDWETIATALPATGTRTTYIDRSFSTRPRRLFYRTRLEG